MKFSCKRLVSALLCLAIVLAMLPMAVFAADTSTVYFYNASGWSNVLVHYWNSPTGGATNWPGNQMTDLGNGYWSAEVPSDVGGLLFTASSSGSKTSDLVLPTDGKNCYTGKEWIVYTGEAIEVTIDYYLRGTMNSWGADDSNKMIKQDDGTYTITMDLAAGSYEYKAGTADWSWGCPANGNLSMTLETDDSVTFTLDLAANSLTYTLGSGTEVVIDYYLRGDMNSWGADDASKMVKQADGTYAITLSLAAGTYEYKAAVADWSWSVPGAENAVLVLENDTDVTFVLDVAAGTLTNDAPVVELPEPDPIVIDYITVVGYADLVGAEWDPTYEAAKMTGENGSYSITFTGVAAGTYEYKFAANGAWDHSWGYGAEVQIGSFVEAYYNGNNNVLVVAQDNATVTVTLDIASMDAVTGAGAWCMTDVEYSDVDVPGVGDDAEVVISDTVLVTDIWNGAGPYTWTAPSNGTITVTFDESACDQSWAYVLEGQYGMDQYWSDTVENGASYAVTAGQVVTMIVFAYDGANDFIEGTVSFEVSFVSNGEGSGDVDEPSVPGMSENDAIEFTDAIYTASVPANTTIWFAFDDSVDYMDNGVFAQQFSVTGGIGFTVTYSFGNEIVGDTNGAVYGEAFCNMNGKYLFSITNETSYDATYVVMFSDIPEEGGDNELGSVVDAEVKADEPWTFYFSIESAGILNVNIGDCTPGWRYKIGYPDGSESLYKNDFNTGTEGVFELTEIGDYYIMLYAYSSTEYDNVDGTVSCTILFTPDDIDQPIVKEEYIVSDIVIGEGENLLTLEPNAITTIYEFCPDQTGIYKFSADNGDALVGYWGAGSFYVWDQTTDKTNVLEYDLTAVGQSIMVGISGVETVTLTVEYIGEAELPEEIIYDYYEITHVPSADNHVVLEDCDTLVNVDITVPQTAVLGDDGFYHLGDANGPVLYLDMSNEAANFYDYYYGSMGAITLRGDRYEAEDGTIHGYDFINCMRPYVDCMDVNGMYPMTEDLAMFMKNFGANQGWYDPAFSNFTAIQGEHDADSAWLVACYYVSCTDPSNHPCTEHDFVDGACTKCGEPCVHDWVKGTCSICGLVSDPVVITKQPASVYVLSGAKAAVSFTAKGDGLTYQWYYAAKGSDNFALTEAFASNSYSVTMTSARNGRQIYCVVTDAYGNTATTDTVSLNMKTELKITKQPVSVKVYSGESAKVTVTVQGDGLTYEWYYANAGSTKYTKTNSFTGNSYKLSMTAARNGRKVYCVITDKYGDSVKTNTVSLKMKTELKILTQPTSVKVAEGKTAKVSFKVQGDGLKYQWYYAKKGSTKYTATDAFTSNYYSIKMNATRNGRKVYCVITDAYGNSVKTKTVSLNMRTTLKITQQPTSVTVANGKTAKVTFGVQGDGLTYKWYYADGSTFKVTSTFTSNYYSIKMTSARSGRRVYCVITDKYGNTVKTNTVTLKMK